MEINFSRIEKKWQDKWEKEKIFEANEDSKKEKYYILEMFPYPSGEGLHMGHALNYTIGDVLARFKRMNGFNVLYPMGYDALGLPAENAAISAGIHPKDYTDKAIKNYIRQQKSLGLSYDWKRIVNTADSKYYKWDQWIFLKMFEKGLAYRKKAPVNWCSKCESVLANEQVHDGKCWRHEENEVEFKHLEQWFLKITNYADELLNYEGLNWPARTIAMQKNWIGKSFGTEINFEVNGKKWPIFTTRPDTIYGVTFMVISAQHPKLMKLVSKEQKKEVEIFLKKIKTVSQKSMKEVEELGKEGIFTGSYAINPITNEKIPVYVGNFVLTDYGSGMIMAVPAHDQRDFDFAEKYKIKIKQVIEGEVTKTRAYSGEGKLINSGEFSGISNREAIEEISNFLIKRNLGKKTLHYKLRDWSVARQRYWGAPIPIIVCEKCGRVPVPEKDLPVKLPMDVKFGKGNPLLTNEEWLKVKCPKCKGNAKRESETMDTFTNSSWYFLRYCDPTNDKEIFNKKKTEYWMPIDQYIGGAEHATGHLIYFRFYTKFLRDIGLLKIDEPAKKLFHQGMLHGEGGIKMSKSKGNIVNPDEVSKKYGIDTARFFLLSLASPDKPRDWSEKGIIGSLRLIKRVVNYFEKFEDKKDSSEVLVKLNKTVHNLTEYYNSFDYRKATIELKELFDLIEKKQSSKRTLETYLKLLHPICPHITEELWEKLDNKNFISLSSWPKVEEIKNESKIDSNLEENVIIDVKYFLSKNPEAKKIYVYALPFEFSKIDSKKISKELGKEISVFAVNDPSKIDPQGKSKKAKPGKPSIYLE